jgi:membrane protein required for beta-lactamase induction
MRARLSVVTAFIPALALVAGLPLVNRLEPVVFGLPFLLFWILAWVLATPAFLAAAYLLADRVPADVPAEAPHRPADGAGR